MASEVRRFYAKEVDFDNGHVACVLATDHDRVVAELRSHVRTDNSAVIAGLQEQMAEARELLQLCLNGAGWRLVNPRIKAWLEKTKS